MALCPELKIFELTVFTFANTRNFILSLLLMIFNHRYYQRYCCKVNPLVANLNNGYSKNLLLTADQQERSYGSYLLSAEDVALYGDCNPSLVRYSLLQFS